MVKMLALILLNTKYFTQAKLTEQLRGRVRTTIKNVPTFPHLKKVVTDDEC